MRVWHDRDIRWEISPSLSPDGIDAIIKSVEDLLEALHDEHSIEWNGNNNVGVLTKKGKSTLEEIEFTIEQGDWDQANIWEAMDYAAPSWDEIVIEFKEAKDKDACIMQLVKGAYEGDHIVLAGLKEFRQRLESD